MKISDMNLGSFFYPYFSDEKTLITPDPWKLVDVLRTQRGQVVELRAQVGTASEYHCIDVDSLGVPVGNVTQDKNFLEELETLKSKYSIGTKYWAPLVNRNVFPVLQTNEQDLGQLNQEGMMAGSWQEASHRNHKLKIYARQLAFIDENDTFPGEANWVVTEDATKAQVEDEMINLAKSPMTKQCAELVCNMIKKGTLRWFNI